MRRLLHWLFLSTICLAATACVMVPPPAPDPVVPGPMARQIMLERISAVIVTTRDDVDRWVGNRFTGPNEPGDADGGSATPISPDGYFLTADHVLASARDRNIFVLYGRGGKLATHKARIVWRSPASDLALLHIDTATPYFYQWTPPGGWLASGHHVIHGGIATGFKSPVGKLRTPIAPEGRLTGPRRFKIDIPLKPGDSGGPVLDAYGRLVGINSAVEFIIPMETAIFVDSEGNRPSVRQIEAIMRRDRARNIRR
ncbi:MAG: S1 family peptidase [Luteolibacter sp.]